MAKPLDLHDMLHGSMSPVPTSKLATNLQPKAGPSRASQVFFRPPTPTLASDSNNDMDTADVKDPNPTITIPTVPTSSPIPPLDHSAVMKGVNVDAFMEDFDDPEAFFASGAKDKVLPDLQAATKSSHNLTKTLNLWSHQGYHLDADAANSLVTKLLQAVYTVSEIGLVQLYFTVPHLSLRTPCGLHTFIHFQKFICQSPTQIRTDSARTQHGLPRISLY
jgi:hypothetical protein